MSATPLTPEQLDLMQHTLGLNQYGLNNFKEKKSTRNYFVFSGGPCRELDVIKSLVELGLMVEGDFKSWVDGTWFYVTDEGKERVFAESPNPPKLSRSKERYRRYLEYGDGFYNFLDFCYWDAQPERSWNQK